MNSSGNVELRLAHDKADLQAALLTVLEPFGALLESAADDQIDDLCSSTAWARQVIAGCWRRIDFLDWLLARDSPESLLRWYRERRQHLLGIAERAFAHLNAGAST